MGNATDRARGIEAEGREVDVVLVGAGIMSTTLGVLLQELQPGLEIEMLEVREKEAQESSSAWNNAGTGHAALCELNYTPQRSDGSIDISKALEVNVEFDLSRQLWSHLVRAGAIRSPASFIHPIPHLSFVQGVENVAFLESDTPLSPRTPATKACSTRRTRGSSPSGSRWSWRAAIRRRGSRPRA
jgi:hypothetical protein